MTTTLRLMGPLVMLTFVCIAAGCGSNDVAARPKDLTWYAPAVKSGFRRIPASLQIEELLGEADHFISYYPRDGRRQTWNSEVYFLGKYELTMQVEIQLSDDFRTVTGLTGELQFYLREVQFVEFYGDIPGAQFSNEWKFGKDDWEKLVAAKGDFSVIGIKLQEGQPVDGFDAYAKAASKDRVRIRPD